MEIKTYKNSYGYTVADCPFCSEFCYVRSGTKTSPDPLRDLKRHITNQAKNEAFSLALGVHSERARSHLDYYKSHTTDKVIVSATKRQFDDDLKISEK